MKLLVLLMAILSLQSAYSSCSRYYIIYIENQSDGDIQFEVASKEYTLKMDHLKLIQRLDLKTILSEGKVPVPNKCRFFINGTDLIKTNGESNLSKIYKKIASDGTMAPVDIFTLTHGDEEGNIEVVKAVDASETMSADEALMQDIPEALRARLGIFHNAACYGLSTNLMATKAGFAASVGSDDETLGPLVLREFLRGYLNGLSLKETSQEILNSCIYNEEWRQTIKHALDVEDHEKYCQDAIIAVVGNADITVFDDAQKLAQYRTDSESEMLDFAHDMNGNYGEGLFKSKHNGSYRPTTAVEYNPLRIQQMRYTQQWGHNPVGQIDIDFKNLRLFKYVSVDNLNFSQQGIMGGQISVLNDNTLQAGVVKRDYAKGILFQVNIISLKNTFVVLGGNNGKGLTWQYALSTKSNLGYLMLKDKNGGQKHFAHIGATVNNELTLRYKKLSLETNSGLDFMLLHPTSSPFYTNGKLQYNAKNIKVGGYADLHSTTGFNAGATATINLNILKKKNKK
jgi:hypothetical protein